MMADEKEDTLADPFELSAEEEAGFEAQSKAEGKAEAKEEPAKRDDRDAKGRFVKAEEKTEAKAEGEGEEDAEGEEEPVAKRETVPHGALHKERESRKAAEKSRQEAELKAARLEERMNMLLAARQQQQQPEAPKAPDPEKDPIGALKYEQEQRAAREKQAAETARQNQQREAQNRYITQAWREAKTAFDAAKETTPELVEAYEFARNLRGAQLKALGMDQMQVNEQMVREEVQLIFAAKQRGVPYHDVLLTLARASGFAPKPKEAAQPSNADIGDKIDNLAKLQARNKSLSNAGGAEKNLSASDILAMDDDEYSAWLDSPKGQKEWRRMNGVA